MVKHNQEPASPFFGVGAYSVKNDYLRVYFVSVKDKKDSEEERYF